MSKKYKNPKVVKFPKMMPIRVTTEMYGKITALAKRKGWDRSKLVRHAISHFIAHQEQAVEIPEPPGLLAESSPGLADQTREEIE